MRRGLFIICILLVLSLCVGGCVPVGPASETVAEEEIPRPTPEPEATPTPTAAQVDKNVVLKVNDEKADKASLEKLQPLLDYLARACYETGTLKLEDAEADFIWNVLYWVGIDRFRIIDTDEIYSIDDNTKFVSKDYLQSQIYPKIFGEGFLPEYQGSNSLIKEVENGYQLEISTDENSISFLPQEYYIDDNGRWNLTGEIVTGHENELWRTITITFNPDPNAIFGFTVEAFAAEE